MSFVRLNAAAVELRNSLRSFVGESAMAEVTVAPPASDDDEIAFVKLVSWSYVLLFEAGRVAVAYLLQLPAGERSRVRDPTLARVLVHDLRTWSFHNLGFLSDRDREISRRVRRWFIDTCGDCPPGTRQGWRLCFLALCKEVHSTVEHCQGAMTTVLLAEDDGEASTRDLRRRIDRAWPAVEFHKIIDDAAVRLGVAIDAPKFCGGRLTTWQRYLESLPNGADLESQMLRVMERDLLAHAEDVLPIDGRDVMERLKLVPGPDVGRALRRAREMLRSGIREPQALLAALTEEATDGLLDTADARRERNHG